MVGSHGMGLPVLKIPRLDLALESIFQGRVSGALAIGTVIGLALLLGSETKPVLAIQDQPLIPRRCHVWGAFEAGAWSRLRVVSETQDELGNPLQVRREVVRTLHVVEDSGYTLHLQSAKVGEARAEDANEQFVENPWYVTSGDLLKSNPDGLERTLKISEQEIRCQLFEYRVGADGNQVTHQDFFSKDVFPYFLRRVALKPSPVKDEPFISSREYDVLEIEVPVQRGDRLISAAQTRTILKTAETTTMILELVSPEIPGGILTKRTVVRDKSGKVVRRETMELEDFGLRTDAAEEERRGQRFREFRRLNRPTRPRSLESLE